MFSRAWLPRIVLGLIAFYIVYILCVGAFSTVAGQKYIKPVEAPMDDKSRAACMADALVQPLETELNSTFGWLPNDLFPVPWFIDNKTSYQRGIIYATRSASDVLAKTLPRLGDRDTVPQILVDATGRHFAYAENVWGWWTLYNSEKHYRNGINGWRQWASLVPGQGEEASKRSLIYNMTTSDIVDIFKWAIGTMDYALGMLNDDKVGHFQADNVVYYVKGLARVVDCVLQGLIECDKSIVERGGSVNTEECLKRLDMIARFNPVYVVAGTYGVGDNFWPSHIAALARHVDVVSNRLTDMTKAMEK